MEAIFNIRTMYLEVYRPFKDVIHMFFVKYGPTSIEDFDVETKHMDKEATARGTSKDIGLNR